MEFLTLLLNTLLLRPYVFLFLAASLFSAKRLLGWRRTGWFFGTTWITAFLCEYASTRIGIPFGDYYYTGSTAGQELYLSNVPFMDSLSFTFLLYASYCLALFFLLPTIPPGKAGPGDRPSPARFRWPALVWDPPALVWDPTVRAGQAVWWLTALLFVCIDIVIDPVALRGDQWFLGRIYGYPEPGVYYGVPVANFVGWAVVGLIALAGYFFLDRRRTNPDQSFNYQKAPGRIVTGEVLLGCGLYYAVLAFNLGVTFWIGEDQLGMTGLLMYLPLTALLLLRLSGDFPVSHPPHAPKGSP